MKASELRIGNWIYSDEYKEMQLTAYNIYQYDLMSRGCKVSEYYYALKPIPLTEEWLIKMGFYKDEDISYRYYFDFGWAVILAYDLDDNCVRIGDSWDFAKAIYVHQMQNLIYALTNEELTIL
jgi:hypothetical protein